MEDRYNVECCEFIHAHDEIVEKVQKEMPSEDTLYDLTELFRIFGDSTRIRISSDLCTYCLRRRCASVILRRCWG